MFLHWNVYSRVPIVTSSCVYVYAVTYMSACRHMSVEHCVHPLKLGTFLSDLYILPWATLLLASDSKGYMVEVQHNINIFFRRDLAKVSWWQVSPVTHNIFLVPCLSKIFTCPSLLFVHSRQNQELIVLENC